MSNINTVKKKNQKQEKLKCGHKDCIYALNIWGVFTVCDYLETVGHSRGCPATPDCIHYKKGRGKRKVRCENPV